MSSHELASVKEQLQENLPGKQIASIFDNLIQNSLKPIAVESKLAKICLANIFIQCYNDNRRKVSILTKDQLSERLFSSIVCCNSQDRWNNLRAAKLERGLLFRIILLFNDITEGYRKNETSWLNTEDIMERSVYSEKMRQVEHLLGHSRATLSSSIKWVQYYQKLYQNFKGMIMEKYIRYAYQECQKSCANTSLLIDKDELLKNFILAIDKALDKYDSAKGALTSYIKWWFLNAKTNPEFNHEYGQSVKVNSGVRRDIKKQHDQGTLCLTTFATSLEDEDTDMFADENNVIDNMISQEAYEELVKMIHKLNDVKLAKLLLDLPYYFSKEEIALIEATTA